MFALILFLIALALLPASSSALAPIGQFRAQAAAMQQRRNALDARVPIDTIRTLERTYGIVVCVVIAVHIAYMRVEMYRLDALIRSHTAELHAHVAKMRALVAGDLGAKYA